MPSLFGMGIGLLLGTEACLAIFAGGLIKWAVTAAYACGKSDEGRAKAQDEAANDTLLAGASVFAAGAVVAIGLILLTPALNAIGLNWWYLAH